MNELSLHILDICQNSIKANASLIEVIVEEDIEQNKYSITIHDDGHGMNEKTLSEVSDPFFTTRTTRNIGMGVSLYKMAAEMANGTFTITSEVNVGTSLIATFEHNHIDRAPLGKIEETIIILMLNELDIDIFYQHHYNGNVYTFDTREMKVILEGIPLSDSSVIQWVKQNIQEGIINIQKEETQ